MRTAQGTFAVVLDDDERAVLAALPRQLGDALDAGEPTLYRLFPPAFSDGSDEHGDYASLTGRWLVDG